jgi:radical SAM family uncharacterized protein
MNIADPPDPLDILLPTVSKPARYTGGEWNATHKDWGTARVRLALAYPDLYELGMSNLGLLILYDIANRLDGVLCERVYAPWTDMEAALRAASLPLFTVESRRPLADFDIIGFTLPHELNYTNILNMLDLAGIPLLARERTDAHPIILGGGAGAYNPEPLADFFDLLAVGEGEEVLVDLLSCYRETASASGRSGSRDAFLAAAARIPGVYVPSFYQAEYRPDGTVRRVVPIHPSAPARVTKRIVDPLPPGLTRPIVPFVEATHDRAMIEIMRGCARGCRFCQAGGIYRPVRERPQAEVVAAVADLIASTGYSEVALVSLSSSDHSQMEGILRSLVTNPPYPHLSLSLPSLRMDNFSVSLASMLATEKRTGLTFAPEAGSQRLRDAINKQLTEEDVLATAEAAFSQGWHSLKLYFMVGLPTETMEDVQAIVHLARKVMAIGRRHQGNRAAVNCSVATFIPKPHSAFQWAAQATAAELAPKQDLLRRGLRGGIHFSWHDPATSQLEAMLARGDRRLGPVMLRAWQKGARLDAWREHFRPDAWQAALEAEGLDAAFYAHRQRPLEETLPWGHIDAGVDAAFLAQEYGRALAGEVTPDCHVDGGCNLCGIRERFGAVC